MKATRLIGMLEEMVHEYGDRRVTFYNGAEVRQVSSNWEDDDVWFSVELRDEAFLETICDLHHGRKVLQAEATKS